jgi:DNA phosphorothioation-dependent restriction protein DptF
LSDPFSVAYQHAAAEGRDDRLCTNFRLLLLQGVHEAISRTLLKAQWRDDQFLTTRTILDFLHHLLTGPGYLSANLFASHSSDLTTALTHVDPCTVRTRAIARSLRSTTLAA